jgi:hypothetical protein
MLCCGVLKLMNNNYDQGLRFFGLGKWNYMLNIHRFNVWLSANLQWNMPYLLGEDTC